MNAATAKHFPTIGDIGTEGHYVRVADHVYTGPFTADVAYRLNILINPDRCPSTAGIDCYDADGARYVHRNSGEAGCRFVPLKSVKVDFAAWGRTSLDASLAAYLATEPS